MTRSKLLRIIRKLPEHQPISCTVLPPTVYPSHKAHWIGWLDDYVAGRTYYGRKHHDRSCQYIWNHLQCGPMLVWLAEATKAADRNPLLTCVRICRIEDWRGAAKCGEIRRLLPWVIVLKALEALPRG